MPRRSPCHSRSLRLLVALACATSGPSASALDAQQPSAGPATARAPYSAAAGKQVVDSMAALLRARYADADTGAMIAAHVEARHAAGSYARVTDWGQFVRLFTQDLQQPNEDTHLFVDLVAAGAPGGPGGPGAPGGPPPSAHGIEEARRLEGNVGYMRMSSFLGNRAAFDAIEGALNMLATTDAFILDLRNSRGGSPAIANFIISHFSGPDTTLSLIVYDRVRNTTTPRYTLASVPGPRRPDVPLFVLTDDVTRSAAEDITFVLQNMGRATVVGSTTAGAGRNNGSFPLPHGLVGSVSFTRVMEPGTRREWERKGVTPDVTTDPDSALAVAHRQALQGVMGKSNDAATKRRIELTLASLQAAQAAEIAQAAAISRAAGNALARFTGTYEGGQTVVLTNGRLVYQPRVAQPRVTLNPVAEGLFAAGETRYRFTAAAADMRLEIVAPDGSASTFARTSRTVAARRK